MFLHGDVSIEHLGEESTVWSTWVGKCLLPSVEAQYGFNLAQTNALAGIQTQDLPDQDLESNTLDRLAMKAGYH